MTEELPSAPTPEHRQLLIVTTADWDAVPGKLRRFEWADEKWQPSGEIIPVVVGKKGMGWGKGVEDFTQNEGPVKREGDLKSPAGVFRLGDAFGYAPAASVNWIKTGYKPVTAATMCIEDGNSAFYNQILDEGTVTADWKSTDHMLRKDDLYEWGMFVAHNSPEPSPGAGSCIFLHVAQINDDGTAGCTAMAKNRMLEVLQWIDDSRSPLLVQIPEDEYAPIREMYNLPDIR
ncbi:MAG: hypothetical protein SF052_02745 [Bacteroidia bacterium]|nr:hypothetical protein [Bacteroidia bacterium]